MANMEGAFDVIVVGAGKYPYGTLNRSVKMLTRVPLGIFGIQAARTYLDVHPYSKLIVLEADAYAGGVWSKGGLETSTFWTD
jgi:hypothetical protein